MASPRFFDLTVRRYHEVACGKLVLGGSLDVRLCLFDKKATV